MKVLVVEDYEPVRTSVAQGLREAGFAVDATGDGREGLWFAQTGEYDAVILDLMLPGTDGLAILKRLRDKENAVPVLILTARDTVRDRVRGLDLGADDYLVKPFAFEELLARVRALVRRKYETPSATIRVGDLEIDAGARTVRLAGRAVTLTGREYAVLEFLALRAGRVVSRTELWEHVYDFNAEPNSNVIDVYVARLRRRLARRGRPPLIRTRRGFGYVLGEDT
ncbi:MAG: response regulator transcription factor [Planctomycetes bacterium]|nr:response regulator transcription factor [Planctomycetota bacterium]